jgi:hypothetical protein
VQAKSSVETETRRDLEVAMNSGSYSEAAAALAARAQRRVHPGCAGSVSCAIAVALAFTSGTLPSPTWFLTVNFKTWAQLWEEKCSFPIELVSGEIKFGVAFFLGEEEAVLGLELRASCLLGRFYHLNHSPRLSLF